MRSFAASHSEHPNLVEAAAEVLADIGERLEADPTVAFVFTSGTHVTGLADVSRGLQQLIGVQNVLGVSASGVVSGGREVESGPGLSVWVGDVGGVKTLRLEAIDSGRTILGLPAHIEPGSVLVILADPFSFPVDGLIDTLDQRLPGVSVVGGMASAGRAPGDNSLLLDGAVFTDGAVAVVLPPGTATPVVSQGCRPIGQPWVITEGSGQMIRQLGGVAAMERLQPIIDGLSPEDRELAARGLHLGVVANEQAEKFEQGDFLIRSIIGADRDSGAIAVGDRIEIGQVVQFHVRDHQSATEDLHHQLTSGEPEVEAALTFTCLARGTNMFPEPHHDASMITDLLGDIAHSGMFCAAEIGPVGTRNAIHSFSAVLLRFARA